MGKIFTRSDAGNEEERTMNAIIAADYQGLAVSFGEDGWFNATEAAKHFGKDVYEWLRLPSTAEYIEELCKFYNENHHVPNDGKSGHLERTENMGNSHKPGKSRFMKTRRGKHGGTWLHPDLAVVFARWLNTRFAIWCDMFIRKILRGEHPHFDWKRMRCEAASSFKVMNEALQIVRENQGKATQAYHYSNEARLINGVLTGKYKGVDRNALTERQLALVSRLEVRNAVLIGQGFDYQTRKAALLTHVAECLPEIEKQHTLEEAA